MNIYISLSNTSILNYFLFLKFSIIWHSQNLFFARQATFTTEKEPLQVSVFWTYTANPTLRSFCLPVFHVANCCATLCCLDHVLIYVEPPHQLCRTSIKSGTKTQGMAVPKMTNLNNIIALCMSRTASCVNDEAVFNWSVVDQWNSTTRPVCTWASGAYSSDVCHFIFCLDVQIISQTRRVWKKLI